VTDAEFATLRDTLGVADSVMSKHLKVLQHAGYVTLTKPTGSGRVRTWVSLTPRGRHAFRAHVAELQRLAAIPPRVSAVNEATAPSVAMAAPNPSANLPAEP
jgi:DNA-binding MarR family transcriptional regulator